MGFMVRVIWQAQKKEKGLERESSVGGRKIGSGG